METKKTVKKALVIFSSTAGLLNGVKQTEDLVRERLQELDYQIDWLVLDKKFEVSLASYDFNNLVLVVAVGGDGTLKVAARTILSNRLTVPLASVPFGSANILATALGLPLSPKQAVKLIKSDLATTKIDVGMINGSHYFLVGFSVGYISRIVTSTTTNLKNRIGHFGYFFRFFFNKIKIRKLSFFIKTPRGEFTIKGNSLVVFNALSYLGLQPKKKIDWQDGILNLYVFTNRNLISLVTSFFYMLWYIEPQKNIFYLEEDHYFIKLHRGLKTCQIDGDYIKLPKDIEIKLLKKALSIVVASADEKK